METFGGLRLYCIGSGIHMPVVFKDPLEVDTTNTTTIKEIVFSSKTVFRYHLNNNPFIHKAKRKNKIINKGITISELSELDFNANQMILINNQVSMSPDKLDVELYYMVNYFDFYK